jgi:hypothetical protein
MFQLAMTRKMGLEREELLKMKSTRGRYVWVHKSRRALGRKEK